ncbi:unannotated protein [freshwater metagenome]|uniref:Unannotated protein n=1 Tax=freshwater metagenome TaxID=449393 RepID=A0A6J7BQS2_9ZZZZ
MEVLEQGVAQQDVVGGFAHDRGDEIKTGFSPSAPTALTRDKFIVRAGCCRVGDRAHDDGLQEADLAYRMYELGEGILVEHGARLTRVGADIIKVELGVAHPGDDLELVGGHVLRCACGRCCTLAASTHCGGGGGRRLLTRGCRNQGT